MGLLGIQFPTLVNKTVSNVAQMATPLALITIGAGFEGRKALAKIAPTMAASMIKLVLQPLVFLPVAAWMGFSGEKMIAILIMLASPTTPSCYIMAKSMNNDEVLTGERYCNNDIDGGIYVDRMDFFTQNIRVYRLVRGKKIHIQQKVSFYEITDYFEV